MQIDYLKIDNSGRSVIYTFYHNNETVLVMITCDIPNKREYFSPSFDRSVVVIQFHLRFLESKKDFISLLFLEHEYLIRYSSYGNEIFNRFQKHSDNENRVSDF